MDVTVLYDKNGPGMRVDSVVAAGAATMLDWHAGVEDKCKDVCREFELDT